MNWPPAGLTSGRYSHTITRVVLAISCLVPLFSLPAFTQVEDAPERRVDAEEIRGLREQAEGNSTLDEEIRTGAVALYDEALDALYAAETSRSRTRGYSRERTGIGRAVEEIRSELTQPAQSPELDLPPNASASRLESMLTEERTLLEAGRTALRDVQQLTEERTARRTEMSRRLGELDRQHEALTDELRTTANQDLHPEIGRAMRRNLLGKREAAIAEKEQLRAQLALFEARGALLPWQRDKAQRRVDYQQDLVALLESVVAERQSQEARASIARVGELARKAVELNGGVADIADETENYAEMLWGEEGVIEKTEGVSKDLVETRKHITDLNRIVELTRRRFEAVGASGSTSQWWPDVPDGFPTLPEVRAQIEDRERLIPEVQHQVISFEEKRAEVDELGHRAREYVKNLDLEGAERVAIERVLGALFLTRRDLLDDLIQYYGRYSNQLVELDTLSRHLESEGLKIQQFLYERLYWSRSVPPPLLPNPADVAGAAIWLTSPDGWSEVFDGVVEVLDVHLTRLFSGSLLLGLLLGFRGRMKRKLAALAERVRDPETDSFRATLEATALTAALAAPLPLALFAGSRLLEANITSVFTYSVDLTLYHLSIVAGLFESARQVLRPNGLAPAHFGWPSGVTRVIHRALLWPEALFLPLMYVSMHLGFGGLRLESNDALQAYSNSLGRIAFVAAMGTLGIALSGVFRPRAVKDGVEAGDGLRARFRKLSLVAFPLILLTTILPAFLAAIGFYLTSFLLAYQFLLSLWLALGMTLFAGLLVRWRKTSLRSIACDIGDAETSGAEAKVRQLFRFTVLLVTAIGLYTIWADALPAAQALKRVVLYPTIRVLDATGADSLRQTAAAMTSPAPAAASGSTASETSEPAPAAIPGIPTGADPAARPAPAATLLTLWNVLQALLAGIITFALVRDVPSLTELILLRRTRVDAGARVAFATLVRYVILIGGASATFNLLGLSWNKIQWLAAALTFGLGFGLQEIVANFVSGLILLFERPVRVGDAVTIGNLQGRVSHIHIRATTITLWDRSEMIVPNKEFVTGKLVNWTLSDSKRRLDIPIRVAYGSDVQQVKRVLLEAAAATPAVMEDPAPQALLIEFGDDALKFELRFFVDFGKGVATKDQIQEAVELGFRREGIEFAIPALSIKVPGPRPDQAGTEAPPTTAPVAPEDSNP